MWQFLVPALAINAAIILIPAVLTLLLAFTDWDGVGTPAWIGIENFRALLDEPVLLQALGNNLTWMVIFLIVPIAIGLMMATLLLTTRRGKTTLQIIYFVPYIISTVVIAIVWNNMIYSPVTGLWGFLNEMGIDLPNPLTRPETSLFGVAAADMWHWWGFLTVVFLASLRQVDQAYIDAAEVEGAGFRQLMTRILIPLIRPTIVFMMVMTVIWSFIAFDFVFVLTGGGPGFSSELLATFAYKEAFFRFQVGSASAISFVMGALGLSAGAAYLWIQTRSDAV
ncbi:MAG: sugar ABC transporter permease [Spirochaetales bacterium]|nr:sugar ABC transporter permease [Spirochaetales bacterium]